MAGPAGAALGGAAAMGSAFAGLHARTVLVERLPVPDPVVGAAEDAIVLCLVADCAGGERGAAAWPPAWRRRRSAPRR